MLVLACFPRPACVLPQGVLLSIRWLVHGIDHRAGCREVMTGGPEKVTVMLGS